MRITWSTPRPVLALFALLAKSVLVVHVKDQVDGHTALDHAAQEQAY
jgi:hypothetical protein